MVEMTSNALLACPLSTITSSRPVGNSLLFYTA